MAEPFAAAYLADEPRARAFLRPDFRDPAARAAAARRAAARRPTPGLAAALADLHRELPPSPARDANLAALAEPGTAVVATGQQVGLYLGPLYTIYKAATAVAVARSLTAATGVRCVPLFWLQTEDHDLAEIDHCHLPAGGGPPVTLRLVPPAAGTGRTSVAHLRLGPDIVAVNAALAAALGAAPHAAAVAALVARHYREGQGLGAAFAGLLAELFAPEGLVLLDPRAPRLAALAADLRAAALTRHAEITAALVARGRELQAAGFAEQVPVRPDASLLFFHAADAAGPRYRLVADGEGFAPRGGPGRLAAGEAEALLARDPLRFSTSALLRPLLQDHLLPTVAYVGGPGEINYFAQLGPLYRLLDVPQPLIWPRARFRLLDAPTRALLRKLDLTPAAAEAPRDELLARRAGATAAAPAGGAATVAARLEAAVAPLLEELEAAAPSLRDPVRRARATFARTGEKLAERLAQAERERDRVAVDRVDRLQRLLVPGGQPQERVYGFPGFAAQVGPRELVTRLLAALRPDDPTPQDLDL